MSSETVMTSRTETPGESQAPNSIGIMSVVLGAIALFLTPTIIFAPTAFLTALVALVREPMKILPLLGTSLALVAVFTSPMCILLFGLESSALSP